MIKKLLTAVALLFLVSSSAYAVVETCYVNVDGYIQADNANWTTCRNATTGTATTTAATAGQAMAAQIYAGTYSIVRTYMRIPIPANIANETVETAKLYLYRYDDNLFTERTFHVVEGTQGDTIEGADFDLCGATSWGESSSWGSPDTEAYRSITLSDAAETAIASAAGGYLYICLREDGDFDNTTPADIYHEGIYFSEQTGTSKDPYLEITTYSVKVDETTNSLKNKRVIAMDENDEGAVTLSGTFLFSADTSPYSMKARVFRRDTSATVQINGSDWTTLTSQSITGTTSGTWSGVLSEIPATNAWLGFEVEEDGNSAASFNTVNSIGVGYVVVLSGQSFMDLWMDEDFYAVSTNETPSDLTIRFRHATTGQEPTAAYTAPEYTGWVANDGDAAVIFANKLQTELDVPIALLDYGCGGSAVLEANKTTFGYWVGSSAADNWYEDLVDGWAISEPMARRKCNAIIYYGAWTDAIKPDTEANIKAGLATLFGDMETDSNYATVPIFNIGLPRYTSTSYTDAGFQSARNAIISITEDSENDNYFFGENPIDLGLTDDIHLSEAAQEIEGLRVAQAVLTQELGSGDFTYYRGPKCYGWQVVDTTHTDVYITHSGGSDFTPTADIDSFKVNTGSWITATGARQAANCIRLTHASGTVTAVRCLYGRGPAITYIVKDNSALTLPIEPMEVIPNRAPGSGSRVIIVD